jgi:tRNA modification GTPase
VLAALVAAGAREALPGEFTRRAVLNGKLDLIQAEAVGDLIDARSGASHRQALEQLDGALSRRVAALRDRVLETEALLAYDIDFPEEDEGPVSRERVARAAAEAREAIEALLATAPAGELVREGALVVIAGPPNAGKSSLFNALLGRARALVTEIPGTTRDAIEAAVEGRRFPLRLVDTAGLRDTSDVVERLGIEVAERWVRDAHLVLCCGESESDVAMTIERVTALGAARVLGVRTKCDLVERSRPLARRLTTEDTERTEDVKEMATAKDAKDAKDTHELSSPASVSSVPSVVEEPVSVSSVVKDPASEGSSHHSILGVSAERGTGLNELLATAESIVADEIGTPEPHVPVLTRERHRQALAAARDEMREFERAWAEGGLPASVAAVHVRAAAGALEELIGVVGVEEVLGRVFATFCVGK